ncbi:MAG TPA: hypothetical protein DC006_07080 [Prevotellaceae bacterium]|nr:hypothetical protein [Prevotellaceae bacterium]
MPERMLFRPFSLFLQQKRKTMDITPQKTRYLYVLLFLTVVMTLPWLGLADFNTKGEPREAIVAQTMLAQDNWVMPHNNGGEIAYKPPFMHWCVAACGALVGEVNEYVARFPSAVSAILLAFGVYFFYARRRDGRTALITAFVSFSSFEMFRAAYACRVDMVLTMCIVGAMMLLEAWQERGRRGGLPWLAILLMSAGTLTKGPVAIVLPCAVAWICAVVRREGWLRETGLLLLSALLSMALPALWYCAAYRQQGDGFLRLFMEENVYRFLGRMSYRSHENGLWYYFVMLPAGLLPWTLLLLPALFRRWDRRAIVARLRAMDRTEVFSLVASLTVFVFYCIPHSKRGVYIMPMYPFVAFFVSQYLCANYTQRFVRRLSSAVAVLYTLAFAVVLPIVLNRKSDLGTAREIERLVGDAPLTSYVAGSVPGNPTHYFTINFYLHDRVGVWTAQGPASPHGFLIVGDRDARDFVRQKGYVFHKVNLAPHRSCDTRQTVCLYEYWAVK